MVISYINAKSENTYLKNSPKEDAPSFVEKSIIGVCDDPSSIGLSSLMKTKTIKKWVALNKEMSVAEIARITNNTEDKIHYWLRKNNNELPINLYSKREIRKIHEEYIMGENMTLSYISKIYNVNSIALARMFRKLKLPVKDQYTIFHKNINDSFFHRIDSEIKAYLLGFFAADGHVSIYGLNIAIQKKDIEILHLFNKYVAKNNCDIIHVTNRNLCLIRINSKAISRDLKKLGYDNNKTYTCKHLPKIPKKYMRHFIRGYFDGDGSIIFLKVPNAKGGGYNRTMTITAHNKSVLTDIVKVLRSIGYKGKVYYYATRTGKLVIMGKTTKINCKPSYTLYISALKNLQKIYNVFYKNSKFYLKRKKEKFEMAIIPRNATNTLEPKNK